MGGSPSHPSSSHLPTSTKIALFKIKIQVKDRKVNALFDIGSECILIFKYLEDELGLEAYDLV
jgi:hypothetical protein